MSDEAILLPIQRTLSIMLTHKCNAQCTHCGTLSGPKVGGRANLASVFAAIDSGPSNGFANVVFTGGEPTIYFDDLLACITRANERGLATRVVSNGGWAKSRERAQYKLGRLINAGLGEINFSTGDEHVRFVPLNHVALGIVAALDAELPVHLMIERRKTRHITKQLVLDVAPLAAHPRINRLGISESPWMPLNPNVVELYEEGMVANSDNISGFKGCDSVLQTYVLHPANEVTTCCGIGARMISELRSEDDFDPADATSLKEIIREAEEDILKIWLRQEGPEKILHWAAGHDSRIQWENMYAHRCQACARLYRDPAVREVVREKFEQKIPDIIARTLLFDSCTAETL
jgi:hypothetical protein